MLSKQEKQKYGQILRQQMKEKQERKKLQDMQKRGNIRLLPPSKQQIPIYKPVAIQKQNSYQRPFLDPKEQFQKKLQTQEYNYFGGIGGGAPNRKLPQQNPMNLRNMSQPNNLRLGAEEMMQFSGNTKQYQNQYPIQPQQRVRTLSQQEQFYPNQATNNPSESISPQSYNYPRQPEGIYYHEGSLSPVPQGRIPIPYQLNPTQNYPPFNPGFGSNRQQARQPISYEIIQENPKNMSSQFQQFPQHNQYLPSQNYASNYPQVNQIIQPLTQQKPVTFQHSPNIPPQIQNPKQYQTMEDSTNEELQQVYKKGGRNLLKLQNQTLDQHMIKQKRKLQIQKQLKQQIEQAERRKKQEKQRLKRQEQQEERKHLAYLAQQKRKVEEEQRKLKQNQQKIQQENQRNLQLKMQMEQEAKRKVEQEKIEKQRKKNQQLRFQQEQKRQREDLQRQKNKKPSQNYSNQDYRSIRPNLKPSPRITEDDSSSVVSSETSDLQKGFNTAMSKEFFRKERERKNPSTSENIQIQKFSEQIRKISKQVMDQRQQMDKVLDAKERAQMEKMKAIEEVQRLKIQLKKKMQEDNQKLLRALQADYKNNNFQRLPPQNYKNYNDYQAPGDNYQNQYPTFAKRPMRQKQQEQLVQKQYDPKPIKYIPKEQEQNQFQQSNVGLVSLDGQSKKIPLFLQHSDKLTISQVQNFAKDSAFFQKGIHNRMNNHSPAKQKYNSKINYSIAEEADEDRDYVNNKSRQSNRDKHNKKESALYKHQQDELDKLIDSRAKSRGGWGEMSSVNSDITKQIDDLLKKKQNGMGTNNGRPSSISNAGKQALSKQGYAYDGLTLNSNVGGTLGTNGTIDLERINGRNEARLRQLKNLGVQTINTNGEDDLSALDQLLNKYK